MLTVQPPPILVTVALYLYCVTAMPVVMRAGTTMTHAVEGTHLNS